MLITLIATRCLPSQTLLGERPRSARNRKRDWSPSPVNAKTPSQERPRNPRGTLRPDQRFAATSEFPKTSPRFKCVETVTPTVPMKTIPATDVRAKRLWLIDCQTRELSEYRNGTSGIAREVVGPIAMSVTALIWGGSSRGAFAAPRYFRPAR